MSKLIGHASERSKQVQLRIHSLIRQIKCGELLSRESPGRHKASCSEIVSADFSLEYKSSVDPLEFIFKSFLQHFQVLSYFFASDQSLHLIVYSREKTTGQMNKLIGSLFVFCLLKITSADVCDDLDSVHDRVDCHPDGPVTKDSCEARRCCWAPYENETSPDPNEPWVSWCFFPSDFANYRIKYQSQSDNKIQLALVRDSAVETGFNGNIHLLLAEIDLVSSDKLRLRITDGKSKRFEVPSPILKLEEDKETNRKYNVSMSASTVTVTRVSTGVTLFSINLAKVIYSDQYIQIVLDSLAATSVFGLGQHVTPNEIDFGHEYKRLPFLNKENQPVKYMPLYGHHPFYLMRERKGHQEAHGVLIFNNNPAEVILQPSRKLVYRTIGGIIDLVIFVGSSANDVVESKNQAIGLPNLPPFWSLGFHLCKYGYSSVDNMNETMRRNLAAGIPLDVQWADIDYMDRRNDFTIDQTNWKDLSRFVDEIHSEGHRFIPILDPAVSASEPPGSYPPFDTGSELDIFIKSAFNESQPAIGKVWNPETSVFPDFSNPLSDIWWSNLMMDLREKIKFDGMWIDMNEPSNMDNNGELDKGCPDNKINNPQFVPIMNRGWFLWKQTICPSSKQFRGNHYDLHNMYGYFEAVRTYSAMKKINPGKRPFILSRSTATGQGALTATWTGDVDSSWQDMRQSIDDIINFNLYGIPMVGADICGFTNEASAELCARWVALGAFYPFSRAHHTINTKDHDPAAMGAGVIAAARNALKMRYWLLPYFYTQFYFASTRGTPVIRSLALEYPNEPSENFDGKFLIGDSVFVSPVLHPGKNSVQVYLPSNTTWYDFRTSQKVIDHSDADRNVLVTAELDEIPVLVKAGSVLPLFRNVEQTTSRQVSESTFELQVILDEGHQSSGEIFFDAGEDDLSLNKFTFSTFNVSPLPEGLQLTLSPAQHEYSTPKFTVTKMVILGYGDEIKSCLVNTHISNCTIDQQSGAATVIDILKGVDLADSVQVQLLK